jgi:hypothetical protein
MPKELDLIRGTTALARYGTLRPNGLELAEGTPFEAWEEIGRQLRYLGEAVQWWIGDWIRFGEQRYGEKYSQALEATPYDEQSLRNMVWVAEHVEPSRRRDKPRSRA